MLTSITTSRRSDIRWLYHEAGQYFPEAWRRFRDGAQAGGPDADLVAAYHALLNHPAPSVREKAAQDLVRLGGGRHRDNAPAKCRIRAIAIRHSAWPSRRTVTHYFPPWRMA